jgi:outer membrane protein TolC
MKRFVWVFVSCILLFNPNSVAGLTLENCQQKARLHYPLIKQFGLLEKSEAFGLTSAGMSYLPQLALNAQASYQSDITSLPPALGEVLSKIIGRPVSFETMQRDQYRVVAEVNQLLWDGGVVRAQKEGIRANTLIEKQKLEVELHSVKERVNRLFFGILVLNEQIAQFSLLEEELQRNFDKVVALWNNGVANRTDIDLVKVEKLKTGQNRAKLEAMRKVYCVLLGAMTGDSTVVEAELVRPLPPLLSTVVNRPELGLLKLQKDWIRSQEKSVRALSMPRAGAFLQGGYGNPGLNMLEPGFTSWYIVGARFSWNISALYSQKNKLSGLSVNMQLADIQKETFLFNSNLKVRQAWLEIENFREQLKSDVEIVRLRKQIREAAEVRLENGTLSVSDFLRDITAENAAHQEKSLREIQLLMAMYELDLIVNY